MFVNQQRIQANMAAIHWLYDFTFRYLQIKMCLE